MRNNKSIRDERVLAKGVTRSNDTWKTGINNNDLIVGASGAGKTRGYVIPNILQHTSESMVVVDTKGNLHNKFRVYLSEKGYKVHNVNLKNLKDYRLSGYNPLRYVAYDHRRNQYSEKDILTISTALVPIATKRDPFWERSTRMWMSALISFVLELTPKECHTLLEVQKLADNLETEEVLAMFQELSLTKPDCLGARIFPEIIKSKNADKTFACIKMFLNDKLQALSSHELINIYSNTEQVNLAEIGNQKTAVFLTVSDCDRSLDDLVSLFYKQCFNALIGTADSNANSRLDIPVRFIMDDFASNCFIEDFDTIISVIRSREISVTLLIQSISQLGDLYGRAKMNTIVNNCDTLLYLGGQDLDTAAFLSQRINKSISTILSLPLNQAYLVTRGQSTATPVEKYSLEEHPDHEEWIAASGRLPFDDTPVFTETLTPAADFDFGIPLPPISPDSTGY